MKILAKSIALAALGFLLSLSPLASADEACLPIGSRPEASIRDALYNGRKDRDLNLAALLIESGDYLDVNSGSALKGNDLLSKPKEAERLLFPSKPFLAHLKEYLSKTSAKSSAPKEFPERKFSTGSTEYRYSIRATPNNACLTNLVVSTRTIVDKEFGASESTYIYTFARVSGKIKLIKNNMAG
ncbi:hypothetical protein [Lysobacter capsici]|uniref:hypothetical protein n=1 Tax=Lysobacter capsici TaxID=435897 RepID=UPI001C005934|nr:hypothetical protein [Lysobacter capsici]QWF19566.1 hypothetical protein KME82_12880 [Lysobacter capsici]